MSKETEERRHRDRPGDIGTSPGGHRRASQKDRLRLEYVPPWEADTVGIILLRRKENSGITEWLVKSIQLFSLR